MKLYVESLKDVLIDRSAPELIGAIVLALLLALAVTGLYQLAIRKVRDGVMLMTGLVVVACVLSMALATGFLERSRRVQRSQARSTARDAARVEQLGRLATQMSRRILDMADRNADGVLSAKEAADAAAEFTRDAERYRHGPLAADSLAEVLRDTVLPLPAPIEFPRRYQPHPFDEPARQRPRGARVE